VTRTSIESSALCRHCGAPLMREKRRRWCPRCHPDSAPDDTQLDLFSAPPAAPNPVELAPEPEPTILADEPLDTPPAIFLEAEPILVAPPPRPGPSLRHYLIVAAGALIVIGGLSWASFQMWPRGSVEKSIVQALAALPHFTERTGADNPFGALAVEGHSSPTFADLDGDGLLDLVTGSRSGEIHFFRNIGTHSRPRFARAAESPYGLVPTDRANAVAFADLRGAGLPDAVNAGLSGTLTFFQNRGDRRRPEFVILAPENDPFVVRVAPARSYDWRPTFADLDRDGDFDLFVGTRDGSILFFENRGTKQKPQFHASSRTGPFGLRGAGELVSLAFGDLDGDGDLDALAGNAAGELRFLENRGNAWRPKFTLTAPGTLDLPAIGPDATVALADLDGDGDLDCLAGSADGHFRYFENLITPAPSAAH
jgi:hypothetical protein